MKVKVNKIHVTIMAVVAVLMLSPCLVQAQDTSRNYVKTVTMLDAGGTDSLQAVQYYNAWDTRQSQPRINFPVPVIHCRPVGHGRCGSRYRTVDSLIL